MVMMMMINSLIHENGENSDLNGLNFTLLLPVTTSSMDPTPGHKIDTTNASSPRATIRITVLGCLRFNFGTNLKKGDKYR